MCPPFPWGSLLFPSPVLTLWDPGAGECVTFRAEDGDTALTAACVAGVAVRAVPLRGQRGSAVRGVRVSTDRVRGPRVRARPVLPNLQKR